MPSALVQICWATSISLAIIGIGVYYLVQEERARRRHGGYWRSPPEDRKYFRRQFARRFVGSSLLVIVGIAVFIGLNALEIRPAPKLYAWFWISVLVALFVMIIVAGYDVVAIRRYARRHRRQLNADRRAMIGRQLIQIRSHRIGSTDDWTPEHN